MRNIFSIHKFTWGNGGVVVASQVLYCQLVQKQFCDGDFLVLSIRSYFLPFIRLDNKYKAKLNTKMLT